MYVWSAINCFMNTKYSYFLYIKMNKLLLMILAWCSSPTLSLQYNEVHLLENSDLYLYPVLSSDKRLRLENGTIVTILCQTLDAKPSNKKEPSVWSKVQYGELFGYIPYQRMEHIESWLPGAPKCECREGASVLCVDDRRIPHTEAASTLQSFGISIGCDHSSHVGCPSFENIRNETLNGLINFLVFSKCPNVQVIGGTELQDPIQTFSHHYSHQNGFRIDFTSDPCIDLFIHKQLTYIGERAYGSPDKLYVACSGNTVAWKDGYWEMSSYVNGGSKVVGANGGCISSSSGQYLAQTHKNSGIDNTKTYGLAFLSISIVTFLMLL
ncbi:hypothetical protein K493DRAFT_309737 [Basidiobolus meristosporus CBS 931.73]|uniref:SH3 domain-containing protein n=1 Tax=Basidiobolus meristosporus CBS 931.73 TaxID=1314790 RepID=A0A1Y1VR53_9FUNG|nr:hypothetical protein K493DRAFT_309737 [Basidiobolus meristosporus CBS 931.73]|eukprot:ORX63535.1 hypothetical protein K493DRAFT_309737 [Basidiobolus meristosporus CBS 931.73]